MLSVPDKTEFDHPTSILYYSVADIEASQRELGDRGVSFEGALEEAHQVFKSILDYTLPIVSVLSGHEITSSIEGSLGEWDIEDLWLPYFCISTNITRAGQKVHRLVYTREQLLGSLLEEPAFTALIIPKQTSAETAAEHRTAEGVPTRKSMRPKAPGSQQ